MELTASLKYIQNFTNSYFIYFSDVLFFTVFTVYTVYLHVFICSFSFAPSMQFAVSDSYASASFTPTP